jgi:hypothetical protein
MTLKNKQTGQAQVAKYEMVGRPPTGKKKKDKNIKVTDEVHKVLGEIGKLTEDYGDVVERLIRYYKEKEGIT